MTTPAEIAVAIGRPYTEVTEAERAQWGQWIGEAELLIRNRMRRLGLGSDLATLDQDTLNLVIRRAVVEQVRKPDDATTVEVAVDDGREVRRYNSSRGEVTIRPEWWAELFPDAERQTEAFSIRPDYTPDR